MKVQNELLENIMKIQEGDPACQLERDAGGKTLVNRTRELESELKTTREIINCMKLQLDALEKEKSVLEVELKEARQALRLVGAIVDITENGTGASNSTIFGKFWGGKGGLGSGIGGRKALGDPGE